jgi:hypothetical protein
MSLCAAPSAPDDRFHNFAGIKNELIGTVAGSSGRFVFFADPRVPSSSILQRQPITTPHVKKATEKIIAVIFLSRFWVFVGERSSENTQKSAAAAVAVIAAAAATASAGCVLTIARATTSHNSVNVYKSCS